MDRKCHRVNVKGIILREKGGRNLERDKDLVNYRPTCFKSDGYKEEF